MQVVLPRAVSGSLGNQSAGVTVTSAERATHRIRFSLTFQMAPIGGASCSADGARGKSREEEGK
jgi:hypothetical protein